MLCCLRCSGLLHSVFCLLVLFVGHQSACGWGVVWLGGGS